MCLRYSDVTITGDFLFDYSEKNSQTVRLSDLLHGIKSHTGHVLPSLKSQRGRIWKYGLDGFSLSEPQSNQGLFYLHSSSKQNATGIELNGTQ